LPPALVDNNNERRSVRKLLAICFAFILLIVACPMFASEQSVNETKLHSAAANDDVATIKGLLSEGVNIETKDGNGRTALLIASHGNKINAAKALIEAGGDVNAKDSISDSPDLMPVRVVISKSSDDAGAWR
jgi:uncharacterized protein